MYQELIHASSETLLHCAAGEPPSQFSTEQHYEIVYTRVLEIIAEQCDAISVLCENGLFRPAHAILRSILENIATLIWVGLDVAQFGQILEDDKRSQHLNKRDILKKIGWEQKYDRSFKVLSSFVHASMTNADMYRNYNISKDGVMPEIAADGEYYIVGTEDGPQPLNITPMTSEESSELYEPFLAAKVFDLVISGLARLYGDQASKQVWWPREFIAHFERLCADDPEIGKQMLWLTSINQ